MRISDWSSDVCSSDLQRQRALAQHGFVEFANVEARTEFVFGALAQLGDLQLPDHVARRLPRPVEIAVDLARDVGLGDRAVRAEIGDRLFARPPLRSEEHTSELQSLMRISYAVFCLKKKTKHLRHRYPLNESHNTFNQNA